MKTLNRIAIILSFVVIFKISIAQPREVERFTLVFDGQYTPSASLVPHKKLARAQIGLALSGGGLRGVSQIGVIKALERNNIPIHLIVGSSIGSVVGGLYASGYTPDEIWQTLRTMNLDDILSDTPHRSTQFLGKKEGRNRSILQFRFENFRPSLPKAYTAGQKISELFTYLMLSAPVHTTNFENLNVPLRIIATDLLSGKKAILKNGDLSLAMRASIAIPLLLDPVAMDSMLLADGGLLDNIPVQETRHAGADYVIAVNTTSPLRNRHELNAPWEIADQVTTIMQVPFKQNQLQKADITIDFSDMQGTSMDVGITQIENFYHQGIDRTLARIEEIQAQSREITLSKQIETATTYFVNEVMIDSESSNENIPFNGLIDTREIYSNLIKYYQTGSYQNVHAVIENIDNKTILTYHLQPYPYLEKIELHGNLLLSDSLLTEPFVPLLGSPINHSNATRSLQALVRLYRKNGYSLAKIDSIHYDRTGRCAHIYISEGRINSVIYSGHKKTKTFVIAREFTLQDGQVFNLNKARQGIRNVFATGLFQSVKLKPWESKDGWNVQLLLDEKKTQLLSLGLHYDRERRGKSYLEFSEQNVLGTANDISAHFQYGYRDKVISLKYRADRIFKSYLTNQIHLHWDESKHFYYKDLQKAGEYLRRSYGIRLILGQQIQRFGTLSGFLRAEKINLSSISGSGYDTGSLVINTLGLTSVVDTRDQLPFPRSGKYHRFMYEVSSGSFLGADISYFQVKNQLSTFWTWNKRHTFCPRAIWGISDLTTPFSEQFRIGGQHSFAGLSEGELQGRHMFIASMKYRYFFPINTALDGYLFTRLDIGAVWESVVDVSPSDFINGRSFGLAIHTPIGPVSVSYGLASNEQKHWYLSAGYDF